MEKYKICPLCNTKNPPKMLECMNCEAGLTSVRISDEETDKMLAESTSVKSEPASKRVRICDCGTKNLPNARKCSSCGEDISDVVPTPDVEEISVPLTVVLSSLDGKYAYSVGQGEVTVGREAAMGEYLSQKSYVSRYHARLTREGDVLYIENLSSTNFTYVNNQKTSDKTKLEDRDEIGLGGTNLNGKCQEQAAYFLVRIE